MNKENWKEEIASICYQRPQNREQVEDNYYKIMSILSQSHQQGRMEMASEILESLAAFQNKYGDIDTTLFITDFKNYVINNLKTNTPTIEVER